MKAIKRTDSSNPDFVSLVKFLDAELAIRDGEEHAFYDQFNRIDAIKYAVVAYHNNEPVGCGAIKEMGDRVVEVKRMFVRKEDRGKGVATLILLELEQWARELKMTKCLLETGNKNQPEAVALYHKQGYQVIENYGQYAGVEGSVCFEKLI